LRVLEGEDGGRVGVLLARARRVYWGGRPVPAGQVSGLSVAVEHRGRGAGRELLRAYLAEAHDRGAAICTLFPATIHLYRRAGFEYAGTWTLYEAAARNLPVGWPDGYRTVPLLPSDDPAPLMERFAPTLAGRSGQIERDAATWRNGILRERGTGLPQAFLVDGPDGPDGWAVLKVDEQVSARDVTAGVEVIDWGAVSLGGWRSLLALAAGFSSLDATVIWKGPDVEPLALLLREQDLRQVRQFRFMARVLDVPDAFAARGYPDGARGQLTLEVADGTCPWVAGTWSVEVEGGEGKAARVAGQAGAPRTDAAGLAALFAGYVDPVDLARLGVVTGLTAEDVSFLQAVHAGPRPWSADFY
ncbi:MAG TPA: GNAT family N-acetyltransferase, partial [Actinomycetota bacterium]|nr:GNAT family N-acetyltransferase [Actinomycetota bacterium]